MYRVTRNKNRTYQVEIDGHIDLMDCEVVAASKKDAIIASLERRLRRCQERLASVRASTVRKDHVAAIGTALHTTPDEHGWVTVEVPENTTSMLEFYESCALLQLQRHHQGGEGVKIRPHHGGRPKS